MSPVSVLPVELLAYVFSLSAEPDPVKTPLVLSSVCRRWRDVSRNTPRLWTRISVTRELLVRKPFRHPATVAVDTTHIVVSLALSRNRPLEILIDARDDEWDFSEPEITPVDPTSTHNPCIAPALIRSALSLLIPHLHRWHSFTILTDTWAPMYYALTLLNPPITTRGAPLLESLTLMRCNDFVSFSPEFRPRHLARPAFLQRRKKAKAAPSVGAGVLPRLRHLALKGVHIDWAALADAVEASRVGGLSTLAVGSHSAQVRPGRGAFRRLLGASAGLEVLSVCGSGPVGEEPGERVRLGSLKKLVVGYRSVGEAREVFGSISGVVREVVLEDVAHPGDVMDVDGSSVLACLLSDARGAEGVLLSQVEELSLRNVKLGGRAVDRRTLRKVVDGATRLRKLKVEDVGVEIVLMALFPDPDSGCPCPKLESIAVKTGPTTSDDPGLMHVGVWFELTKRMLEERALKAAPSLRQVKISMELPQGSCTVPERLEAVVSGTFIGIELREKTRTCEVDEDEEVEDEAEAYLPGGTFNDPVFDARWASSSYKLGVVV